MEQLSFSNSNIAHSCERVGEFLTKVGVDRREVLRIKLTFEEALLEYQSKLGEQATGELIGDCGLTMQRINGEIRPEIGYHIRGDQQRKGYANT